MGLYIDHVNTVLTKLREPTITALATNADLTASMVQTAVKRAVRRVWNAQQWTFKQRRNTITTVAATELYLMPREVGESYSVKSEDSGGVERSVTVIPEDLFDMRIPDPIQSGWPTILTMFDLLGVTIQPSSASVISVSSSNASDTTQIVLIRGVVSSRIDVEEVTLSGVTPVDTTKSFTTILSVTKSAATAGRITLTSNSAVITNVELAPQEKTLRLRRIRLYPIPDAVYTITVKHFAMPPNLTTRYEDTEIPEKWDYIIDQYAFALALQAKGQDQSQEFVTQFQLADKMLLTDMVPEERQSSETIIIPQKALNLDQGVPLWVPSGFGTTEEQF